VLLHRKILSSTLKILAKVIFYLLIYFGEAADLTKAIRIRKHSGAGWIAGGGK
jgi:hypothetical protein